MLRLLVRSSASSQTALGQVRSATSKSKRASARKPRSPPTPAPSRPARPRMASDIIPLEEHIDIPYRCDTREPTPLQSFDLYTPYDKTYRARPLICFVHGGAWRSEDKADHAQLARRLASRTRLPVAVPNYRLSTPATPVVHPGHAQDLVLFLEYVRTWLVPGGAPLAPAALYLVGHSCSAHMLTSIFLAPPAGSGEDALAVLAPSRALKAVTRGIVLSEGLYDLDLAIRSFPRYKQWFIQQAFGERAEYAAVNTAAYGLREGAEHIRWLVLHSDRDTLVDRPQSESIYARLRVLYEQAGKDADEMVEKEWETLQEEHNDMLRGDVYPKLVADFVAKNVQRAS